jgi:hypothetical protein
MQKVNELRHNNAPTKERTQKILTELDRIQKSLEKNGIEVRAALKVVEAEIKAKKDASR